MRQDLKCLMCWYMCLKWLNGRAPVHKFGNLRFKSQLRHKFFSQYLSSYIWTTGAKVDWDFRISYLVKNPDGTDKLFNLCGDFQWSSKGSVSQIHSPHLHAGALGIFLISFKVCSDAKEKMGCGKVPHLFIFSKTTTFVPAFAVEDLPLGRILWWW